jgi:hypothetical protein
MFRLPYFDEFDVIIKVKVLVTCCYARRFLAYGRIEA